MTAETNAATVRPSAQRGMAVGYAFAAGGAALFSTKAIMVKLAYVDQPDAALLLAWRMLFSLPMFVAVGLWAVRSPGAMARLVTERRAIAVAAGSGLIGYYVASLLDFEGLVYITAQLERLVLFTYPIFVMLLGYAFFGARLSAKGLIAASVTYLGLAVVFQQGLRSGGSDTVIGTLLVLGSALTFALYQLLAKGNIARLGSMLFTSIAMSAAAVACIAHYAVVSGGFEFSATPSFILYSFLIAVFATVVPSFLINAGLGRIGPQSTAMISTLSPLFTIVLSIWILGERFTLIDALGTALVIGGIGLYTWFDVRRAGPSAVSKAKGD